MIITYGADANKIYRRYQGVGERRILSDIDKWDMENKEAKEKASKQRKRRIRDLYRQGHTKLAIARIVKVSPQFVYDYLNGLGYGSE